MDEVDAKEIRKGKRKEIKDKQAKKIAQLGTIIDELLSKLLKNMLKHNLLQFELQGGW